MSITTPTFRIFTGESGGLFYPVLHFNQPPTNEGESACTCGPDEACSECPEPANTSNVAVLIEVSPSGAGYIAQPEQWSQFGVGDTPYEALSDFFAVMAEHMDFLQTHEDNLTRGLANELGHLRTLAGNGRI